MKYDDIVRSIRHRDKVAPIGFQRVGRALRRVDILLVPGHCRFRSEKVRLSSQRFLMLMEQHIESQQGRVGLSYDLLPRVLLP